MALVQDAFFTPPRDLGRILHLGASHRYLQQHYSSKSDSGKYAQLIVDSDRVYLPGGEIRATISVSPSTVHEIESIEVDCKGEVHTFGWVNAGPAAGAGGARQRRLRQEKQVLFLSSARVQTPSMQAQQMSGIMSVFQKSPEDPLLLEAVSRLPISIAQKGNHSMQMPLPSIYHDAQASGPAAYITYHWKLTVHRKGVLKSDERQWKPLMVVALAQQPNNNPSLNRLLTYPPHGMMGVRGMYREIKKYMVKTAGMMEIELALPMLKNHPLFRPVPAIVRISVRAKSPSDLLQPNSFALPQLPAPTSTDKSVGPQFFIRRYRRTQVYASPVEQSRDKSVCKCRWDGGHLDNGFTQQANGKGFERGREGSTPLADQRARAGQSHGWTWPARSDLAQDPAFFSTPTTPFPKGPFTTNLLPGSARPPDEAALKTFLYVTTSTLFAMVYLHAHPNINVTHLSVFSDLCLDWKMEGARNDLDTRIDGVSVNLGLDAMQGGAIGDDDLKRAIWSPETLSDQSLLLQGHFPAPPPPAFMEKEEQLPSYPGPSRS